MWSTTYGILQPRASLKTELTKRNDGFGFYSNRAATVISRVTKIVSPELRLNYHRMPRLVRRLGGMEDG